MSKKYLYYFSEGNDAFGGDNAPLEVIKGSRNAKDDLGVDIALVR